LFLNGCFFLNRRLPLPPHSTAARVPTVEAERRRDLILVESMVRDGYPEAEIVAAVRERHGLAPVPVQPGSLLHRLGSLLVGKAA
jgi:hypothetical protein